MEETITYEVNNKWYSVTGLSDLHVRLQSDAKFSEDYFQMLEELQGQDSSDLVPSTKAVQGSEEFKWSRSATLLLLNLYKEKTDLFRSSKVKNKDIWMQILKEFKNKGYTGVTVEVLDRKLRNLKKTYKDNRDKKNRTGESSITWEYFDLMDEIFFNDRTINPLSIISSMESNSQVSQESLAVNAQPAICDRTQDPQSGIENSSEVVAEKKIEHSLKGQTDIKTVGKPKRTKHLYEHRKRIQDIERQRLEEVRKLREAIERNNVIQKERNEILKELLRN